MAAFLINNGLGIVGAYYSLLQIMLPDWKERKSLLEKLSM